MRRALVTGAGGAIGRAIVQRLAADGYDVIAADRDATGLTEISEVAASTLTFDVTDDVAVAAALRAVESLDVVVTAAGIGAMAMTASVPAADWRRTLETNLTGTFLVCQAALPALVAAKGCIVTIASSGGLRATPYNAAYNVSKAGVIMLTKVLAVEHAKDGVRANAVCPSSVRTPFLKGFMPPPEADMELLKRLSGPAPRLIETAEVADAVGYLVSPSAAAVTGTTLVLDAGSTS
ncbi:MAG TPA: SDR family NAD(P)-dependent oxidoreductase [Mycobacteriales bacterium]|nr:SDR family NAD(P)-dependent oxidoreductase [Mycobacteriales bacterium]